jgi:hypothetical protein
LTGTAFPPRGSHPCPASADRRQRVRPRGRRRPGGVRGPGNLTTEGNVGSQT